jgi:hypothetical protein
MRIESNGEALTLRWGRSASVVPLTPMSETEFLDRSSFGTIRFNENGLVWTQGGKDTPAARGKD